MTGGAVATGRRFAIVSGGAPHAVHSRSAAVGAAVERARSGAAVAPAGAVGAGGAGPVPRGGVMRQVVPSVPGGSSVARTGGPVADA